MEAGDEAASSGGGGTGQVRGLGEVPDDWLTFASESHTSAFGIPRCNF